MPNYDYRSYQKRNKEPMNAYYYYKMTGIINADRSNMPESQKHCRQKPNFQVVQLLMIRTMMEKLMKMIST